MPTFSGVTILCTALSALASAFLEDSYPDNSNPTLLCLERAHGTTRYGCAEAYDCVAESLRSPPINRLALKMVVSGRMLRYGRASYATAATSTGRVRAEI